MKWGKIMNDIINKTVNFLQNLEFSELCILLIICSNLIACFWFVSRRWLKDNVFINLMIKSIFYGFTIFTIFVIMFKSDSTLAGDYLERINIIATIALAVIALKMSIEQNRMSNFDFSEKIGFPNLKLEYKLGKTDVTNLEQYTIFKQTFISPLEEETEIFEFIFNLDKPLNPQIFYDLKKVRVFDSRVSPQQIKNKKELKCDTYKYVSFESNSLENSTIHILVDDTEKHFLPVLKNPENFFNENCNELTVVFDFSITDLVNNAFKNKQLYLIVRFTKLKQPSIEYKISSVQTFVYK